MKHNIFKNIIAVFLLGFVSTSSLIAQEGFQRFYPTENRALVNVGSISTADGGFYMLNVGVDNDNQTVDKVQVSRNNPKGNLTWTKEYSLTDQTLVTNLKSVDFVNLLNDTLVLSGITQIPGLGLDDEKFIMKIDPTNGDLIWSGIASDMIDQTGPITLPVVLDGYDNTFVSYNTHGDITSDTFGLQRIHYNSNNEVESQQAYYPEGLSGTNAIAALVDAANTVDSNTVISFIAELSLTTSALLTLDKDGALLNSVNYSISPDSIANYQIQTSAIAATQDTGVVMTGFVFQPLTNGISNFLIKTDSIGVIQWSKIIDATLLGLISQVNDVVERSNGEIVVSGKYFNTTNLSVGDFIIFFDANGNVVRQLDYQSDYSFFFLNSPQGLIQFTQGEMGNTSDGGILYSTTGFDSTEGTISPYIVKTDFIGGAMCNDTLDFDIVTDFEFIRDTLIMGISDYAVTDTLVIKEKDYEDYDVIILQLIDTVYCPQDPIMQTIDATLEGATMYEWSTGEMTPSIFVTEEGEFSVTVTLGDKVCYTLCDTANISKLDFPEAGISVNLSGVCELGEILLTANSTTSVQSVIWANGETTNTIVVTEPGTYAVTITDNCDNSASTNVEISDQLDTDFESSISGGTLSCANGTAQQELQVSSNSGFEIVSVLWNTGATTETITGNESTDYSVTLTNECGSTSTATFSVPVLNADIDFSLEPSVSGVNCNSISTFVILQANVTSSQSFTVTWSDGSISNQIQVTEPGTYTATVLNECGDEISQSVDVTADNLVVESPMPVISVMSDSCDFILTVMPNAFDVINKEPTYIWSTNDNGDNITVTSSGIYSVTVTDGCGNTGSTEFNVEEMSDAIVFADIFFPAGEVLDNRSFGPYLKCPDTFIGDNFVFEIFNRFGNKVFESNSLNGRWNGAHSGSPAPRDVYIYLYSYDVPGGVSQSGSGSVTLMR